ncbi:MAG: hypothetical protein JKX98_06400 [Alcanivoracaceae bacterium]|nr:hypothetical protein [Alcanivoracaceae bacterium]
MFSENKVDKLAKWFKAFDFDIVLLNAGGNDFVTEFFENLFENKAEMSVDEATELVINTGQYNEVRLAYRLFISKFISVKPDIPIIAHIYDYLVR